MLVETAGGGAATGGGEGGTVVGHFGLLEGVSNAEEIRNLILAKWNESRSAGVGDDPAHARQIADAASHDAPWSNVQISVLESIRDLVLQLE